MRGHEGKSSTGANGCVHAEPRDCILEGRPLGAISSNVEGESPVINHASCEGMHEALHEGLQRDSYESSNGTLHEDLLEISDEHLHGAQRVAPSEYLHGVQLEHSREPNGGSYGFVDLDSARSRLLLVPHPRQPFVEPPVFVRTFGHFDIFVEGKPVVFRSPKEKELVALLVDRNGGTVTPEEAITCLWEDELVSERTLNRYRKLCQRTKRTLGHYGLSGLIEESRGVRSFNRSMVTCDYYEMMAGNEQYSRMFGGSYLSNYSWAESTLGAILRMMMVRSPRNQAVAKY